MRKVVNDAMDVQGGSGICMGPRNLLGRVYQSIPIGITVEGANILTRSLIIFGQGAVRAHPYVLKEMRAATDTDPQRASEEFDKAFFGHIGFTVSNAMRALLHGLTGANFAGAPQQAGPERHYYQQLTRMSAAFALVADASMLMLGGALKRKEKLSGRLADVLSHLYLASTVLKRYADQGRPTADLPLLQWACDDALHQMQEALDGLLRNLPNRGAAALLRLLVFPLGKPYAAPHDALGHKAASLLLEPSEARDRLTLGVYVPADLAEPMGRLEDALRKTIAAEAVEKKLRSGASNGNDEMARISAAVKQGVISEDEAGVLLDAIAARKEVIKVDDFAPEYWKTEEIEWPTEQKTPARRFI